MSPLHRRKRNAVREGEILVVLGKRKNGKQTLSELEKFVRSYFSCGVRQKGALNTDSKTRCHSREKEGSKS